jgi:argininosuccinate lyase
MYDAMFSVEEVNRLAAQGMPFRDAYRQVGLEIENGTFRASHDIHHTHEGSIGNLCNEQIRQLMNDTLKGFTFERAEAAERRLLEP